MILKQKYFFKSREVFLRTSSFCTFADLNHGFGRPWDILWIFLLNATFIMLQKKAFGQFFFFEFLARVKKCHFGNFEKMAALLNPCMKFKKCFGQKPSFEAGSAKSIIKVSRSTKRGFSKKALTRFDFCFCLRFL